MDHDFENSIILGYGPTKETHCEACKGNARNPLPKGYAFYCLDRSDQTKFIAGPDCREKIHKHPLSTIPHFGATRPSPDPTDKDGGNGSPPTIADPDSHEKLVSDMSAWIQLRQEQLPALGFSDTYYDGLTIFMSAITKNIFDLTYARKTEKIYESIIAKKPKWQLENLQKCHDVALQIVRIETSDSNSDENIVFLSGIKHWLTEKYFLTPKQVQGLNNIAKRHGEPAWTSGLEF